MGLTIKDGIILAGDGSEQDYLAAIDQCNKNAEDLAEYKEKFNYMRERLSYKIAELAAAHKQIVDLDKIIQQAEEKLGKGFWVTK